MIIPKAYMNWSGGKDSGLCLYRALQDKMQVQALVTCINQAHNRISMHGVRTNLLYIQAASTGLPLHKIELPEEPDMTEYEALLEKKVKELKAEGFSQALFGDIFLEDLKKYREEKLKPLGIDVSFPLWGCNTKELMREFLALGFKAIIVCINERFLDKSFCGRLIDESFVNDLPANVDICGENGEYHSFVFDGPLFQTPVNFSKGEIVHKKYKAPQNEKNDDILAQQPSEYGFYFLDLVPAL